jgi:hypothetical protein
LIRKTFHIPLSRRVSSLLGGGWRLDCVDDLLNHFIVEHVSGASGKVKFSYHNDKDPLWLVMSTEHSFYAEGRGEDKLVRAIRKEAWGDDLGKLADLMTDASPDMYETFAQEFRAVAAYLAEDRRAVEARVQHRVEKTTRRTQRLARRNNRSRK